MEDLFWVIRLRDIAQNQQRVYPVRTFSFENVAVVLMSGYKTVEEFVRRQPQYPQHPEEGQCVLGGN